MKVFKRTAAFLVLAWSFTGVVRSETITVKPDDTPSGLAASHCGGASNHALVWSGNPKRLPVGRVITLPQECTKGSDKKPHEGIRTESTDVADVANTAPREFKNLGADPLCTTREVKNGTCREKQEKKLIASGWTPEDAKTHLDNVYAGRCVAGFVPNGFEGDWLVNGSATWGKTVFAIKGASGAEALSCPEVNGKKPYVVTQCRNITGKYVPTKPIIALAVTPPPPVQEAPVPNEVKCVTDGYVGGRFGRGNGIKSDAGVLRASCQFRVNQEWTAGPGVGFDISNYSIDDWDEKTRMPSIGIFGKGKGVLGMDSVEPELLLGFESTWGRTDNQDVQKPTIHTPILLPLINFKKSYPISRGIREEIDSNDTPVPADGIDFSLTSGSGDEEGDRIRLETTIFAKIPLGNKSGPVYWRGQEVDSSETHPVAGIIFGVDFELDDWDFIPGLKLGGWYTWGVKEDHWGGKFGPHFATRDRQFELDLGVELPRPHFFIDPRWNFGGKALMLSAEVSKDTLTNDAADSRIALGLDPVSKESPIVIPVAAPRAGTQQPVAVDQPKLRDDSKSQEPEGPQENTWPGWNG